MIFDKDTDDDGVCDDTRYYYSQQANYNVVALTEDDGDIVEKLLYDPYGEATVWLAGNDGNWGTGDDVFQSTSSVDNPYLFQGRRWDSEADLYYFRNRSYSSLLGRFLQRDPTGYLADMNLYGFVRSQPPVAVDPLGYGVDVAISAALVGGGGLVGVTCCDEDGCRWWGGCFKLCIGAVASVGLSVHCVGNLDGPNCPDKYNGYFLETGYMGSGEVSLTDEEGEKWLEFFFSYAQSLVTEGPAYPYDDSLYPASRSQSAPDLPPFPEGRGPIGAGVVPLGAGGGVAVCHYTCGFFKLGPCDLYIGRVVGTARTVAGTVAAGAVSLLIPSVYRRSDLPEAVIRIPVQHRQNNLPQRPSDYPEMGLSGRIGPPIGPLPRR